MIDPSARVRETADLEADVAVGGGTSIWPEALSMRPRQFSGSRMLQWSAALLVVRAC